MSNGNDGREGSDAARTDNPRKAEGRLGTRRGAAAVLAGAMASGRGASQITTRFRPRMPGTVEAAQQLTPELIERLRRLEAWRSLFLTSRPLDERLRLLHDFGLTDHDVAAAIPGAKARSIRRWRGPDGPPQARSAERWRAIDDLYYTVSYFLADGSFDEDAIIAWLRSRQPELSDRRPLDVLHAGGFEAVREAAEAVLSTGRCDPEDLADLPPQPAQSSLADCEPSSTGT